MKFEFIAVNFNGHQHTEEYLKSIENLSVPENGTVRAIIVDNGSQDEDRSLVRRSVKRRDFSTLVELPSNLGYFGGLNAALDTCEKSSDALFIVGNNDLAFHKDFLINLSEIPLGHDVMVIAPNVITLDGRRQNPHVVSKVPKIELIKARIYFSNYYIGQACSVANAALRMVFRSTIGAFLPQKNVKEPGRMVIKRGIGACYVLTPFFFEQISRLDDRVFLWGEEALLSNQISCAGGLTLYDPTIKVTHFESAAVRFVQKRKRYEMVRESYRIYRPYL